MTADEIRQKWLQSLVASADMLEAHGLDVPDAHTQNILLGEIAAQLAELNQHGEHVGAALEGLNEKLIDLMGAALTEDPISRE